MKARRARGPAGRGIGTGPCRRVRADDAGATMLDRRRRRRPTVDHHGRLPAAEDRRRSSARTGTTDVAAFEKQHPNITIKSKDAFPCNDPRTFTARLAGGQLEDVFYGYMTDLAAGHRPGQAADITTYADDVPNVGDIQPDAEERLHRRRQALRPAPTNYSMGLVYNQAVPAGRSRPEEPAEDLGRGPRPPPRRSPRSATASPATPSTAPATPAAGTSPPSCTPGRRAW